jgi:hypothetical protein
MVGAGCQRHAGRSGSEEGAGASASALGASPHRACGRRPTARSSAALARRARGAAASRAIRRATQKHSRTDAPWVSPAMLTQRRCTLAVAASAGRAHPHRMRAACSRLKRRERLAHKHALCKGVGAASHTSAASLVSATPAVRRRVLRRAWHALDHALFVGQVAAKSVSSFKQARAGTPRSRHQRVCVAAEA